MIRNMSTTDRAVRAAVAVAAVVGAVLAGPGTLGGVVLLAVAGIMAVTSAVGFCPLYRLFGVSTCRTAARR